MPHPDRMICWTLCAWFCCASARSSFGVDDFAFFHENVMGTSLELRVLADDRESARWAEDRVLGEIDRLALIFSGYDSASEFSRWQAAPRGPMSLSAELFDVLSACDAWRNRSGGAFDPRVEVMTRLWSRAAGRGRVPEDAELAAAKALLAHPAWRSAPGPRSVERLTDCPLSLNAIAKGYIVDRACAAALVPGRGLHGLLLNVGGDLRVCGEAPRTLGIAAPWADSESTEPIALLEVQDRAVSTSGSSQRGFRVNGHWYSHILDPRSGLPADRIASAVVVAPRSIDADALATICNLLTPGQSLLLASSLPDVECLIITSQGQVVRSAGWHRYEPARSTLPAPGVAVQPLAAAEPRAATSAAQPAQGAAAAWSRDFELEVDFEINQPDGEGRRYRRPYVAIWVENKEGFPIRNLTLWVSMGGAGPFQWLPDLKRWYRADQARKEVENKDLIFTTARPTRPPGKYKVIWDGKDDHGNPVASGEYTILIDAAREHGTYQNIRKPVALGEQPFTEQLKGNVEIKSAAIEYRRKAPAKASQ
jgi:FAD:protein FMN transferase